jgi:hypothetical protein
VHASLDDLVIALYVTIDEWLGPNPRRHYPGRKPRLSDAELVCLAVAQVLLGSPSEHRWLRCCYGRLGHLFPYLPNQPGYHKRFKAARWLLGAALQHLATRTPRRWIGSACWTPPPCPVAPPARRSRARRFPAGPTTAGAQAIPAGTGASSCTCSPPRWGGGGLVPGQPQPWRTRGRRGAA